jgi:hypothetical protein
MKVSVLYEKYIESVVIKVNKFASITLNGHLG